MHTANRMIYATKEEILDCKNNPRNFAKFLSIVRSSGWLTIYAGKKARAYKLAEYKEWISFIEQGLWKTIERADERITIPSVLRLSLQWAKVEYKKLYDNMAQKTEDECDAMEKDCDGELTDIQIPDYDPRFEDVEIRDFLAMMEKKLPAREMNIFRETMDNETVLRDLGKSLGLSHERCRQLLVKAREQGLRILAQSMGMTAKECKEAYTRKVVEVV